MKKADFEDVDDALHAWMREAHARDIPSPAPSFKPRTSSRAGTPRLKCSNRWLSRFKTSKGIGFHSIKGEAKAVKPKAMDAWKNTLLPKLLKEYSPDDTYNTDKTGPFYKLQPSKSLVFKDENGIGGKCSKSRITVMPVANISSTHKLKPLVINNCWKPPRGSHTSSARRGSTSISCQWSVMPTRRPG